MKVLLVDDHPVIRVGIRCSLANKPGIEIIGEVDNAADAVRVALELQPDVVLMDINLPDGDGISAAAEIRQHSKSVRILMLTSHLSRDYVLRSINAGASGYFLKGDEPDLLYLAIKSVAHGAIWFAPTIAGLVTFELIKSCSNATADDEASDPTVTFGALSSRERDVLELLACGLSNQEVADRLNISVSTTKAHVRNILKRLGVADRTQAALKAVSTRWVQK